MMLEQDIPFGEVHYSQPTIFGWYQQHGYDNAENARHDNDGQGGEVKLSQIKTYVHLWEHFCEYSHQKANDLRVAGRDTTYQHLLQAFWKKKQKNLRPKDKSVLHHSQQQYRFLQTMVHAQIEIEYAAPIQQVSASFVGTHVDSTCVFCGADYYVPVEGGGFDKILKPLVRPLEHQNHIKLNRVVTKIEYTEGQPGKVTYFDKSKGKQRTKLAKAILVTVPLGVLKKQTIDFVPPLPQAKLDAIDAVGFGVVNKCVFYWEKDQYAWWPEGKEVLTYLSDTPGTFTTFFNDKELGNGGHFVLSAWTGGTKAVEMEGLSDQTIVSTVLANLQQMFGEQVPAPANHVISRWGQDEFALGAYSYSPVGREGLVDSARRELGARTGSLFWAGEATHPSWSGTTVGAYERAREWQKTFC